MRSNGSTTNNFRLSSPQSGNSSLRLRHSGKRSDFIRRNSAPPSQPPASRRSLSAKADQLVLSAFSVSYVLRGFSFLKTLTAHEWSPPQSAYSRLFQANRRYKCPV